MSETPWKTAMDIAPDFRIGKSMQLSNLGQVGDFIGATFKQDETISELHVDIEVMQTGKVNLLKLKPQFFTYLGTALPESDLEVQLSKMKRESVSTLCFNRLGFFMVAEKAAYEHKDVDAGDYDELPE